MDIDRHVHAIQADLAAAAALGDEATAAAGERLAAAVSASLQLRAPRRPHGRHAGAQRPAVLRARRGAAGRAQPRPRRRRRRATTRPRRRRRPATTSAPASPFGSRRGSRCRSRPSRAARASRPMPGSCARYPVPSSRGATGRAAASDFKATPRAREATRLGKDHHEHSSLILRQRRASQRRRAPARPAIAPTASGSSAGHSPPRPEGSA